MSKQTITVIVLLVLLLAALGFIGYNYYANSKAAEQQAIFTQGAQYGYQQTILSILQQATTCQTVPLFYGNSTQNQTINMIAVECPAIQDALKKAQAAQ